MRQSCAWETTLASPRPGPLRSTWAITFLPRVSGSSPLVDCQEVRVHAGEVSTRQLDAKTCLPYICRLTTHDEYARCCLWPTNGQLSSVAAVGDSWCCICSLFELPAHPARIVRTASHVSRGLPAPMLVDVPSSPRPTDSSHRLWPPRKLLGSQGLQPLDGLQAGPRDRVGAPTYECRHATVGCPSSS